MTRILTSLNSPLRIDAVELAEGGRIGMTLCPGKQRPGSISGHWVRDLAVDLDVIRQWPADIVITLLEDFEFGEVGVTALGPEVAARGMRWLHLPIPDKAAPGALFQTAWQICGAAVHTCLATGGNVLIHCMGGIGRTGTVAAQILIERGMQRSTAIDCVRRVRQGAIETPAQEAYLLNLIGTSAA